MEAVINNKENIDERENSFELLNKYQPVSFKNGIFENNCFISVVLQSFFHFTELKNYLKHFKIKNNTPKLIIELIALLNYCKDKNNEKENIGKVLNLNPFRKELASVFHNKKDFQINQQGDPIELLNFLFIYIHDLINLNQNLNNNPNKFEKNCVIHKLFYINLHEISKCIKCKKEKILNYDSNYFIHLLNVNSILENIKELINFTNIKENLFLYTKYAVEFQKCEKCKTSIEKSYNCELIGKYFIINLGWNGNNSKMEDLCNLYIMIPKEFELKDLFEKSENKKLIFKGMFLYWSNHYICLFYEKEINRFIIYDDQTIKNYSSWKDIIEILIIGKYQPVLVIYEQYTKENSKLELNINEKFYNNIVKKCKENDEKEKSIKTSLIKINEDEWMCEYCNQINNNDSDTCIKCGKVNENITFLLQSKFEILNNINEKELTEENKLFLEKIKNKKQLENEEKNQKWKCPVCQCKTNLINDPICFICKYNSNEKIKEIQVKEKIEFIKYKERGKNKKKKKKERKKKKIIEIEKKKGKEKQINGENQINEKKNIIKYKNLIFFFSFMILGLSYFLIIK